MSASDPRQLWIMMYHYVVAPSRTRYAGIKGIALDKLQRQLDALDERYEMTTLEAAVDFLGGRYMPTRDLCLLTFDDGLKEHYEDVTPLLRERGLQGVFFVSTSSQQTVAAAHKNHFLLATLDFAEYRDAFTRQLALEAPEVDTQVDGETAARQYRFDPPAVAQFKYLLNFLVTEATRNRILDRLFVNIFGDEAAFARELYLSWPAAREMQRDGMVLGGHAHEHMVFAAQPLDVQRRDLTTSREILARELEPQAHWPFAYPYGSYTPETIELIRELGFTSGFTIERGPNPPTDNLYELRRLDPNDVPV